MVIALDFPTKHFFASFDFNLTDNVLPPADPAACVKALPDLATGLIVFDVLIANSDRHASNLSLDDSVTPAQMNVFDHSHALLGTAKGNGEKQLNDSKTLFVANGHCLIPVLDTDQFFDKWYDRVARIPDFFIDEVTKDAEPYGLTANEVKTAAAFLKHRRDNIRPMLQANSSLFKAIKQPSLQPATI
jgi:hypothetical protein